MKKIIAFSLILILILSFGCFAQEKKEYTSENQIEMINDAHKKRGPVFGEATYTFGTYELLNIIRKQNEQIIAELKKLNERNK